MKISKARSINLFRKSGLPFRAPHHSVSQLGMLSEVALAAGGVLFIDEAEEFRWAVLSSALRTVQQMDERFAPHVVLRVSMESELTGLMTLDRVEQLLGVVVEDIQPEVA